MRAQPLVVLLAALGALLHWLPFKLPGWIARCLSRTPDDLATYKLLAGLLVLPLSWLVDATLAFRWSGLHLALASAAAAPLLGYAALIHLRDGGRSSARR